MGFPPPHTGEGEGAVTVGPSRQSWPCVRPYTSPAAPLGTRQKSEKGISADLGAMDLRPPLSDHASEKSWFSMWKFLPLPFTSLSTSLSICPPPLHSPLPPSTHLSITHLCLHPCTHPSLHPSSLSSSKFWMSPRRPHKEYSTFPLKIAQSIGEMDK